MTETRIDGDGYPPRSSRHLPPHDASPWHSGRGTSAGSYSQEASYDQSAPWDPSGQGNGWERNGSPWNGPNTDPPYNSSVSSTLVTQGQSLSAIEPDALEPDYVSHPNGPPSRDPLFDTPMPWADLPWEKEREAQEAAARYASHQHQRQDGTREYPPPGQGWADPQQWGTAAGQPAAGYANGHNGNGHPYNGNGHAYNSNGNGHPYGGNGHNGNGHTYGGNGNGYAQPDSGVQVPGGYAQPGHPQAAWSQPGDPPYNGNGHAYNGNGNGHPYNGNGNGHTYGGNGHNGNGHTYGGNGNGYAQPNGYGNGHPTGVPFKSYPPGTGVTNPGMTNPGMPNPGMTNPGMTNPGMPGPGMTSPGMPGPGMTNPAMHNPGMTGPGMTNPAMPNTGITGPGSGPGGQPYPPQGPGVSGTYGNGMGTNGAGMPPAAQGYAGPATGQWGYGQGPPTAPGGPVTGAPMAAPPTTGGMMPVQTYPPAQPVSPTTITARATTSPGMRAARRAKSRTDTDITVAELAPPGRHERAAESGGRKAFVEKAVTVAHTAAIEDARLLTALRALVSSRSLFPRVLFLAAGFCSIGPLALAYIEFLPLPQGARFVLLPASLMVLLLCFINRVWGRRALTGYFAGVVATIVYDCVRWALIPTGIWADPIPDIGRLLLEDPDAWWGWGYVWRFFGNGAGMGMAFTMLPWRGVKSGTIYGCLIATGLMIVLYFFPVAQAHFFPLTPFTFVGGYIGHIVYGAVLGWITSYLLPPPTDPTVRLQEFAENEMR